MYQREQNYVYHFVNYGRNRRNYRRKNRLYLQKMFIFRFFLDEHNFFDKEVRYILFTYCVYLAYCLTAYQPNNS